MNKWLLLRGGNCFRGIGQLCYDQSCAVQRFFAQAKLDAPDCDLKNAKYNLKVNSFEAFPNHPYRYFISLVAAPFI